MIALYHHSFAVGKWMRPQSLVLSNLAWERTFIMKPRNVRLFIKPGCSWCAEAKEGLRIRGVTYTELDVTSDPAAWDEMKRLTGQTKAPCLDVDGHILADFGAHELDVWWLKMGFEDSSA